jgi:hypothetical protein
VSDIEFKPWPKIARLNRDITITEKIDGTNAAIVITEGGIVGAQSRNRLITPEDDHMGFAAWVDDNRAALISTLGPGHHFGEWWGQGIGPRKYGLDHKRFSLFNTSRWTDQLDGLISMVEGLYVVPVLYEGPYGHWPIGDALETLAVLGSRAAPGFMDPEGIVVFHHHANMMFKVTLKGDEVPKGAVA